MIDSGRLVRSRFELLDTRPEVNVQETEYRRLLGYPKDFVPGERSRELADGARRYFAEYGRPWVYVREASLDVGKDTLRIDGVEFTSKQLHEHLVRTGAQRAVLMAVSAGRSCEDEASRLWKESKPDEYFFMEIFGSSVVEYLVASTSGKICDLAERDGLVAVPHYSPGYTGWDVADQNKLFELTVRGMSHPFPEPMEVLSSGMLRPKKSLLAVVGLAPRSIRPNGITLVPCEACSFNPCQYRRAAYKHAPMLVGSLSTPQSRAAAAAENVTRLSRDAKYSTNARALRKWSDERVRIERSGSGAISAQFRFDGTTCSNQGFPLAFEYNVSLSSPESGYKILSAECRPVKDDEGYQQMCAYLSDREGLMKSISEEKPLIGRPLNDVVSWERPTAPSGCYCSAESRNHKWGLALEAIHYTLVQAEKALESGIQPPVG